MFDPTYNGNDADFLVPTLQRGNAYGARDQYMSNRGMGSHGGPEQFFKSMARLREIFGLTLVKCASYLFADNFYTFFDDCAILRVGDTNTFVSMAPFGFKPRKKVMSGDNKYPTIL